MRLASTSACCEFGFPIAIGRTRSVVRHDVTLKNIANATTVDGCRAVRVAAAKRHVGVDYVRLVLAHNGCNNHHIKLHRFHFHLQAWDLWSDVVKSLTSTQGSDVNHRVISERPRGIRTTPNVNLTVSLSVIAYVTLDVHYWGVVRVSIVELSV